MSIQFRARIKSAADYTGHLSDNGVCCYSDGSQGEDSYISCMNAGGYFQYIQVLQGEQPSDVVCPELSDTGCCCACEYVDDYDAYLVSVAEWNHLPQYLSGLKDVSRCECNRIGGVWSIDSCDTYEGWEDIFNLCTGGAYSHGTPNPVEHDRRFPEGCCVSHQDGSEVDDGPWYECNHVCSSRECSDLQNAAWPRENCCPTVPDENLCIDCPYCCAAHYPTIACGEDPTVPAQDWISCGDESATAYASGGNAFTDDEFNNILVVPKQNTELDIDKRYQDTIIIDDPQFMDGGMACVDGLAELAECKRDRGGTSRGCPEHDYFGGACWDIRESLKAGDHKNYFDARYNKCRNRCGGGPTSASLVCEIAEQVCGGPNDDGSVTPLSDCAQCIKDNFRGIPSWNNVVRWGEMCTAASCSVPWWGYGGAGGDELIDCCGGPLEPLVGGGDNQSITGRYTSGGRTTYGVSSVCITTEDRVDYDCKIKTKNLCSGIWMGLNEAGLPFKCKDAEVTTIRDFLKTGTISKEIIDGWKIGEHHIAGYYAGIFNHGGEDATHVSLEGFGNPKTGPCIDYRIESESKDVGEFKSFTKSQYAVLILPHDLETNSQPSKLHSKNQSIKNQSKSKFDSVRNMATSLDGFNVVNSYTYNGIGGWAIPAQSALAFMANQIQKPEFIENTKNNKAYKWHDMKKSYWSSSLLGDKSHQLMAYIQDFNTDFVSVCPVTMQHRTRPVRMIKIN